MKYMNIRLTPRFNVLRYNITHFIHPFEEPRLSIENGEEIMATDEILKNAMEIIRAAYDIQVQVKEWDCGEEKN